MRFSKILLVIFATLGQCSCKEEESKKEGGGKSSSSSSGPPPFFLQDSRDGLCLAGEEFKRCGIDTLFFVVGSPGTYQIHKRPVEEDVDSSEIEQLCISKKTCGDNISETDVDVTSPTEPEALQLLSCTHCGAKKWNILGEGETGYILTYSDGNGNDDSGKESSPKTCVYREKEDANGNKSMRALTGPCDGKDTPYTPLNLQFASKDDIAVMNSPGARLIAGASAGDLKLVKSLISKESIDVNSADWDGLTSLITASAGGHYDVVKYLLDSGADVNAKDKDGITALMEAGITGHVNIVELLLENGADIHAVVKSGVSALWLAAGEGRTDVLEVLVKHGGDVNIARADGVSALMTASAGGHAHAVKFLLNNDADPQATDNDDLTSLTTAAEKGSLEVLKLLVDALPDHSKEKYVNHVSKTGFTALIVASAHGHLSNVKYLLEEAHAGVDHAMAESNVTPLMYAAASGFKDVVNSLLDHGADVNAKHSNQGTALLEASTAGTLDTLKILIERGASIDMVDKDGVTSLMSAASQGHYDCVLYILDTIKQTKKSDEEYIKFINLLSYSGGSAVMFSSAAGIVNVTQYLIDQGADVNAIAQATPQYLEQLADAIEKNQVPEDQEPHIDGVTALHVAAQGGHLKTVETLINAGANVQIEDDEQRTPLLLAVKGNHGDTASKLVEAGANPNQPYVDDDGESHHLLMDAIIVENEEFALLLAQNGADLYYQDDHQVTTLLQAAHRGMTNVVQVLLEKHHQNEASQSRKYQYIDLPSDEGITPLIAAASEGHTDIVNLMIQANADINAKDKDKTTAIMAASARGHLGPVQALIQANADINVQNMDGHTALMFAYNGKNQVETLWERYHQFVAEAKATNNENAKDDQSDLDDGGTGPIIKEALANHTLLVDLLKKAGADEALKDKEGHVANDFDFHPDLDAQVLEQEEKAESKRDSSKNEL